MLSRPDYYGGCGGVAAPEEFRGWKGGSGKGRMCVPFPLVRPAFPETPQASYETCFGNPSVQSIDDEPSYYYSSLLQPPPAKKISFSSSQQPSSESAMKQTCPPPLPRLKEGSAFPPASAYRRMGYQNQRPFALRPPHHRPTYDHHYIHGGKLTISIIVVGMIVFLFFIGMMVFFRNILFSYSS